ncbi:interleukin-12 subunit beta isoform X2 [Oryzias melastigma]|nr:interleukin-12 subunit beta isoform X2 [Oryzias melastigma]
MILSVWTLGLLLVTFGGAHGHTNFPANFVVAKRNDPHPVTLTCNTQTEEGVSWRLDGEEVELDNYVQMEGPNLKISEVDAPMLGEYSCWRGGTMLSSTYLFQELEEDVALDSLLNCRAKSYDCNFTCSWRDSRFTAVRLGLGHDCSEGQRSCRWETSGGGHVGELQFVLPHSLSPYAEESTTLELTAEAINTFYILRRTKTFYLRDIIQPDSPQIVRCQEVGHELNVTLDPPPSWSTPHSFFSLEYEIEYEMKDDGKIESSFSTLIPKKISKLRVRSRDSLVLSAWSQWTAWQNVRKGKKNRYRCKKGRHGDRQDSTPRSSDRLKTKRRHKKTGKQSKSRLI